MERKIGEIFEYKGEWYQCIKSTDGACMNCDMNFDGKCPIPLKECAGSGRSDKSYVIFKRLEKIGEPEYLLLDGKKVLFCGFMLFKEPPVIPDGFNRKFIWGEPLNAYQIFIELKQNQEDMEEKKLNLKPFDLEAAKAGKPVCTRDGSKARIICFDYKSSDDYSIIALVDNGDNEMPYKFSKEGKFNPNCTDAYDLMMLPEKKEGWVNIIKTATPKRNVGCLYDTREEALSHVDSLNDSYVATVKLEWEE